MKLWKKLGIALGALVVLLVAAVFVVAALAGSLAQRGIEAGATYALGVRTTLGSARVGVLSGTFGMSVLEVANPKGFPAPHFLQLGDADVAVTLASLTKDTIRVPRFSLDALDVHLEGKDGKSNYQVILDNLEKLSGPRDPGAPAPAPKAGEKKLIIDEVTITNVNVHVDLLGLGSGARLGQVTGAQAKVDVPIREIKLHNVGKTGTGVGGTGVTVAELASIIVQAVFAAVLENAGDVLPADVLADITGQLKDLDGLVNVGLEIGGEAVDVAEQIGQQARQAGEDVKKTVEEAGKTVEELGKGLEGILGGGKNKGGG